MRLRDAIVPRWGGMAYQLALLAAFALIGGLLELPFDLYGTFRIEQRFGFNRMTWKLYLADHGQGRARRRRHRPAARRADAVDHGRRRPVVVAVGLGLRGWRSTSRRWCSTRR